MQLSRMIICEFECQMGNWLLLEVHPWLAVMLLTPLIMWALASIVKSFSPSSTQQGMVALKHDEPHT